MTKDSGYIGGVVIDTEEIRPGYVWVSAKESGSEHALSIVIDPGSERIRVGDQLYWKSDDVVYTPYKRDVAIQLRRVRPAVG